jgi:membrane fusion protein, multidrug efflux system
MDTTENKPGGGKRVVIVGVGILLMLGIVGFLYWFLFLRNIVSTDDARLDSDIVNLAPQVSGVLTEIKTMEGSRVTKGQLVFSLKKDLFKAGVQHAEASLEASVKTMNSARAAYEKAVNGPRPQEIKIAENEKMRLEAEMELASIQWKRAMELYKNNSITESEMDTANAAWKSAVQAYNKAVNSLSLLQAGTRKEDLKASLDIYEMDQALVKQAQAALEQARLNLDYTDGFSPYDGYVVKRWIDPGTVIQAGTPVLSIMSPSSLYVSANITEKDLYKIAIGDQADFSIDSYPGKKFSGEVESIMRVVNSRFSLIPAEGVSGTFIKLTQRVPIRVKFEIPPGLNLGPGLSVQLHIHTKTHDRLMQERR